MKKKLNVLLKIFTVFAVIMLLIAADLKISGLNAYASEIETYTLTIDLQGHGENQVFENVEEGTLVSDYTIPFIESDPEDQGFVFIGVAPEATYSNYDDLDAGFEMMESLTVTENMTVYAIWFEEILAVELTFTPPPCGTEVTVPGDRDSQAPQPEVTVPEGKTYHLHDSKGTINHSYFLNYMDYDLFEGMIKAGEDIDNIYIVNTHLYADFGHAFSDENTVVTVNGAEYEQHFCYYDYDYEECMTVYSFFEVDHIPGDKVIEKEKEATCLEDGSYDEVVYCEGCKDEISRNTVTISKTGHDWGEWKVEKEATTKSKGLEKRVCKNDPSHVETKDIPVIPETTTEETTTQETTTEETTTGETTTKETTTKETTTKETVTKETGATDKTTTKSQVSTTSKNSKAPKTGDESSYWSWMALLFAAAAVILIMKIYRKRTG